MPEQRQFVVQRGLGVECGKTLDLALEQQRVGECRAVAHELADTAAVGGIEIVLQQAENLSPVGGGCGRRGLSGRRRGCGMVGRGGALGGGQDLRGRHVGGGPGAAQGCDPLVAAGRVFVGFGGELHNSPSHRKALAEALHAAFAGIEPRAEIGVGLGGGGFDLLHRADEVTR